MNKINSKNLYTERLDLKIPTMSEQHRLWEILSDENVNQYYFPTPDRILKKNNLSKNKLDDLKLARKIFLKQLCDWERQKVFYESKIETVKNQEDSQKFTWSVFLKNSDILIGQITCQPKKNQSENIRDVGWFIAPEYQGQGYATEAAIAVLTFMFEEVDITDIYTSAAEVNSGSWRIMEKLGFELVGYHQSTYFKDNEILVSRDYHGTKKFFFNKMKK